MATSTFNITLDSDLKRRVEEVSSDIGLTPTAVFNVFARQFVAHHGFPFAVVTPVPTEREFTEQMDSTYLSMRGGNAAEHELIETQVRKVWSDHAWDDYVWWQSQDKKTLKRINTLIKSIERSAGGTVSAPVGKAERLRHSRFGLSSVRIDAANRLVYKIEDGALLIVSCKGHYQQ